MTRPARAARGFALGLVFVALAAAAGCGRARGPESIVLITVDTLRADRVGPYAPDDATVELTPTLDRLAREGVVFEDASTPTPLTLPAHTSLFTGRYPTATGVRNNGTFVVPTSETTLAELLADAGYATAAVVAAYPLHARYGLTQGFEIYDDAFQRLSDASGIGVGSFFPERDATAVTDRALEVWARLEDGRRFLWVHYFDPHAPYSPPEAHLDRAGGKRYDGEVAYVDAEIERLLEGLDLDPRRSIVTVTADHGEGLGEHDELTHGVFLYDTTVRVPWILWAPGRVTAGARVEAPVSLVDVAPTIAALVGLDGAFPAADGTDLRDWIDDPTSTERSVYGESFLPRYDYGFSELRMWRRGPLKYIDAPTPELYDLGSDPGELRNLAGGHYDEARLRDELAEWRTAEDTGAADRAAADLDGEARASLQSLGYAASSPGGSGASDTRGADPKTMTAFIRRYDRALGLLSTGDTEGGLRELAALRDEQPDNPAIRSRYASGLLAAGRLEEAVVELRAVVEATPDSFSAMLMLAETHGLLGHEEQAEARYADCAALEPWSAEPWHQLGALRASSGRFDAAAEAYVEALRREPDHGDTLDALVTLRRSRGDLDRVADDLAAVAESDESSGAGVGADLLGTLASVLHELDRPKDADAAARRAYEIDPGSLPALHALGEISLDAGRPDESASWFALAVDAHDSNVAARVGLARAHARLGRTEDAVRALDAARALDPRDPAPWFALGEIREADGATGEAAGLYRRALTLDPNHRRAWDALERLRTRGTGP